MRTTLKIDDDVIEAARSIARAEGRSVGEVISRLARKGLRPVAEPVDRSGFPVFQVSPEAEVLTPEMVRRAEDDT